MGSCDGMFQDEMEVRLTDFLDRVWIRPRLDRLNTTAIAAWSL